MSSSAGPMKRIPPPDSETADHIDPDEYIPGKKNLWLFDIVNDPLETTDISEQHIDVVKKLLGRLAFHNSTAVPVMFPPFDPKSNPDRFGGVWSPWED